MPQVGKGCAHALKGQGARVIVADIDMAGIKKTKGIKNINIKPQYDEWVFPDGHSVMILAEGRLMTLPSERPAAIITGPTCSAAQRSTAVARSRPQAGDRSVPPAFACCARANRRRRPPSKRAASGSTPDEPSAESDGSGTSCAKRLNAAELIDAASRTMAVATCDGPMGVDPASALACCNALVTCGSMPGARGSKSRGAAPGGEMDEGNHSFNAAAQAPRSIPSSRKSRSWNPG